MPLNRGTRRQPKWCGYVKYKGRKKWVGTHDSLEAFKDAKERCRAELREEVDNPHGRRGVPTVGKFAGATIDDDGQITMTWPDGERAQKATGRRGSTVRHMRDGLRPFIREFHDRPLDSFRRDEALTWIRPKNANVRSAVRQFFNHALDRDLIPRNQFTHLGASKRKRRVDRPDFQIITDEQYERLLSLREGESHRRLRAHPRGRNDDRWRDGDAPRRNLRAASARRSHGQADDPCALATRPHYRRHHLAEG